MQIVKVRMKTSARGSPDGLRLREYEAGRTYDLPKDLARAFVEHMKVATYVRARTSKRNPGERD